MINRKLADIVKGQELVALAERETVQEACRYMWECRTGSVLVVDDQKRLTGIFTGRDAVRTLAEGKSAKETPLAQAMTPNPITSLIVAARRECRARLARVYPFWRGCGQGRARFKPRTAGVHARLA